MIALVIRVFMTRLSLLARSLYSIATRYPWQAGCIALLCLAVWLYTGKNEAIRQRDEARGQVGQLIKAANDALSVSRAFEKKWKAKTNDADDQANSFGTVYRTRVMRLPAIANCSPAPRANNAGSSNEAGEGAIISDRIAITRDDALICADNTARLQAAHNWAKEVELLQ